MRISTIGNVAVLVAGAVLSGAALADQLEQINVQGSRVVTRQVGHSTIGAPIDEITLSYGVSTAGLDLATREGVDAMRKRVEDTATTACRELGRIYPDSEPGDRECERTATRDAMIRVDDAAAAARGQKP